MRAAECSRFLLIINYFRTYIISTPNVVRPRQVFQVSVSMLRLEPGPVEVRASILEDSIEVVNASTLFNNTGNQLFEMTVSARNIKKNKTR